jgi:cyclopropane fatty-acyl-phospholipid synthase-like methyltransferase
MSDYQDDIQLKVYSGILKTDYLHYGYWSNPETVKPERLTIQDLRDAQIMHAEKFSELIPPPPAKLLDAGCGIGAFSNYLSNKGYDVDSLTPEAWQIDYIRKKYPRLNPIHSRYEEIDTAGSEEKYDAVLMLESAQYIYPDSNFRISKHILKKNGKLFISDYFVYKKNFNEISKSGHQLDVYLKEIEGHGLELSKHIDITDNVLPTVQFLHLACQDIIIPVVDYVAGRFRKKHKFMYVLLEKTIHKKIGKMKTRMEITDPVLFKKYKHYAMLEIINK